MIVFWFELLFTDNLNERRHTPWHYVFLLKCMNSIRNMYALTASMGCHLDSERKGKVVVFLMIMFRIWHLDIPIYVLLMLFLFSSGICVVEGFSNIYCASFKVGDVK